MIYSTLLLGQGYNVLQLFCGNIRLKCISRITCKNYTTFISDAAVRKAAFILNNSRNIVIACYAEKLDRHPDSSGVLDIDVTVDGT